ncbi:MAG: hypothetical protein Q9M39_04120 [Sulfurovum sp.]|nr:hypothetical protein [Sulfurovum sp.]
MKKVITLLLIVSVILSAKDYTKNKETQSFIDNMMKKNDYERVYLEKLFSNVKVQKSALRAFTPRKKQKNKNKDRKKYTINLVRGRDILD